MLYTTLIKLLDDYRAEARLSLNVAHNTQQRDTQVKLLQRVQEGLWDEYTWPHLRVRIDVPLQKSQRYYGLPDNMKIDRIEKLEVFTNGLWRPLFANIEPEHLNTYNSDLGREAWPPIRWQLHGYEEIEIWPIPSASQNADTLDGTLRFTGIRNLNPLVADTDRADLDDRVIVLYAAAETLAATGAKDAQAKLDRANAILRAKRNGLTPRKKFNMFGIGDVREPRKLRIGAYKSLWTNQ